MSGLLEVDALNTCCVYYNQVVVRTALKQPLVVISLLLILIACDAKKLAVGEIPILSQPLHPVNPHLVFCVVGYDVIISDVQGTL